MYRRAIEAGRADGSAPMLASLADAWEQLGEALRNVGEPAAAAKALTEARRLLPDDPIAQARLCHRHAEVAERSAALTAAVRWLMRGVPLHRDDRRLGGHGLASADALISRRHSNRSGALAGGDFDMPPSDHRS